MLDIVQKKTLNSHLQTKICAKDPIAISALNTKLDSQNHMVKNGGSNLVQISDLVLLHL
jgi:hypothetical protein